MKIFQDQTRFCKTCNSEQEVKNVAAEGNKTTHGLACGHRFITLELFDQVKTYDMIGFKKKGKDNISKDHKWEKEVIVGERIGRDGKLAYVHQVIDRGNNFYKKFVKQGDKIIKDIQGKLTDHK